jgi:hypothetical protein
MLKLSIFEFLVRSIPEGIAFVFAGYAMSNVKVIKTRMYTSGIMAAISIYLIRMLPIHFGVHTILSLIVIIFLLTNINQINIMVSVGSVLLSVILLFILDSVVLIGSSYLFNIPSQYIINDTILKTIMLYPSLLIFILIISIIYLHKKKNNKLK